MSQNENDDFEIVVAVEAMKKVYLKEDTAPDIINPFSRDTFWQPEMFEVEFSKRTPEIIDPFTRLRPAHADGMNMDPTSSSQDNNPSSSSTDDEEPDQNNVELQLMGLFDFSKMSPSKLGDIDIEKVNKEKLFSLTRQTGFPAMMRPVLWAKLSGAEQKKNSSRVSYEKLCEQAVSKRSLRARSKKIHLTLAYSKFYDDPEGKPAKALKRILLTLSFLYPDVVISDNLCNIVAFILLVCHEEMTFWIMAALVENMLPPQYFSLNELDIEVDVKVLFELMKVHSPEIVQALNNMDHYLEDAAIRWTRNLFTTGLPADALLRFFDLFFIRGSCVIFQAALSLMKLRERSITTAVGQDEYSEYIAFEFFSMGFSYKKQRLAMLYEYMASFEFSVTEDVITNLRTQLRSVIKEKNDLTGIASQSLAKRSVVPKTMFHHVFPDADERKEILRMKNILQTEIMAKVKRSVKKVLEYFDTQNNGTWNINFNADYSDLSHELDKKKFYEKRGRGPRKARAILDFARQDGDDLGFRKNDIITIISDRDEHCWVGEINGLRGWFPAKFVQIINDHGMPYAQTSDGHIDPGFQSLVKSQIVGALEDVFAYKLKNQNMFGRVIIRPWHFIESFCKSLVIEHGRKVLAKISLSNSFRLHDDMKTLEPVELLLHYYHLIVKNQEEPLMDEKAKLRTLIYAGLNENCLHIWIELFCTLPEQQCIRGKYYEPTAIIRSPAWREIKCELRLLTQIPFLLRLNCEVRKGPMPSISSTDVRRERIAKAQQLELQASGVSLVKDTTDMLMKHCLYSWELP